MSQTFEAKVPIQIRARPADRDLIDRAAAATGKTRTDFMLDAARQAATDAILDKTHWVVDAETFAKFEAALDAGPNEKLRRTMRTPAVWDKK